MKLTEEQKEDYIKNGDDNCPICKSNNIEGGSYNPDSNWVLQALWCNDCNFEWEDVYKLVDIEPIT